MSDLTFKIKTCKNLMLQASRSVTEPAALILEPRHFLEQSADIGLFAGLKPEEARCSITGQSCVLYMNTNLGTLNFSHLGRCPSAKPVEEFYTISGRTNKRKRDAKIDVYELRRGR